MILDHLIPTLLAASCLTQGILSSPTPTGPITSAPDSPSPTAALVDLRRHRRRSPLPLSIDWSGLTPESLLPWLFGDDTAVLPTATVTGIGGTNQCTTFNVPGGETATICGTGAAPAGNTGGIGTGIGTGIGATAGVSGGSAGAGASAGTSGPITSFTSASASGNGALAATTLSGNHAPMPSRGLYMNMAVVIPIVVLGVAL